MIVMYGDDIAEFIFKDGKLVTDGIPFDRIPSNMNLRTVKLLKIATDINCTRYVKRVN